MQWQQGHFEICLWRFSLPIAIALVLLQQSGRLSAETATRAVVHPLRGEFAIGKDGRLLVLPVRVGRREFLCLLDTGARLSGFDVSLREMLGDPEEYRMLATPAGMRRVEAFHWPEATLGGQPLRTEKPVVCMPLDEIRSATNQDILGVIGMDVLRSCRLQIDFDRGVLSLLESLPENRDELGEKVAIRFLDDAIPVIFGRIGDDTIEPFLIDTGAQGNSLGTDFYDTLLERDEIRSGSSSTSVTVAGQVHSPRGRLRRFSVGPFTHQELRFSRLNLSSLGIRYFSRFKVTFDFPGECVYMSKSAQFDKPEPRATSGLVLQWVEGATIVQSVRADGPGAAAGLKAGDALVRINGEDASEYDPFALRELLTSKRGRRVPMTIRRGAREFEVALVLDEG